MKLVFAALLALGLSAATLWLRYDILGLSDWELKEPMFIVSVSMIIVSLYLTFEAIRLKRRTTAVVTLGADDQPNYYEELVAMRTLLGERDGQRLALEAALRDVEGRLATEQAKKQQSTTASSGDAHVVQFLSLLQERGRLIDFLMQDVQTFGDEQVGRAARVVHQGCRAVVQELFSLTPVATSTEGETITVEAGEATRYRLIGSVTGTAPYRGRLLHRGWRAAKLNLPTHVDRSTQDDEGLGLVVSPAEVELFA